MFEVLRDIPIRVKILLMMGIPMISGLVFAGMFVYGLKVDVTQAVQGEEAINLIHRLGSFTYENAKERGLSAAFSASGGARFGDRMRQQRIKADASYTALKASLITIKTLDKTKLKQGLSEFFTLAERRNSIREKIDQIAPGNQAFAYYSKLNMLALDMMNAFITEVHDPSARSKIRTLNALLRLQEQVGIVRGRLVGIYSSKKITRVSFRKALDAIDAAKIAQTIFLMTASKAERKRFNENSSASLNKKIQVITGSFMNLMSSLNAIHGPDPAVWFTLMTQKLEGINNTERQIVRNVLATAKKWVNKENLYFRVTLFIVIVGTLLVLIISLVVLQFIVGSVQQIRSVFKTMLDTHNLTLRMNISGKDEIGLIGGAIDEFLIAMESLVRQTRVQSEELQVKAVEFADTAKENQQASHTQQEDIDQVAAAVTEMSASIQEVAQNTVNTMESTDATYDAGFKGKNAMNSSADNVNKLAEEIGRTEERIKALAVSSNNIGGILDTIRSIAEQTNLLALNAAIEAARAGEHGRGFAVVADEVRTLAKKTQDSTDEIQSMIEALQTDSHHAQESMDRSHSMVAEAVKAISESVHTSEDMFTAINSLKDMSTQTSSAAEEQAAVSEDINQRVVHISEMADSTSRSASVTQAGSVALAQIATSLNDLVNRYKCRSK